MLLLPKRTAFILYVILLFCVAWVSSSSSEHIILSWQCLPKTLPISTNLACSRDGTTYIVPGLDQSIRLPKAYTYTHPRRHLWSYKPVCTAFLPGIGSELCVYTNIEFGHGRGISIFTTPQVAQTLTELLPFQDPTAAALDGIYSSDRLHITNRTPNKGRSSLASHHFERGDLVSSAFPIVIEYDQYEISHEEREELLRVAVFQLPIASQRLLSNLTTDFGGPRLFLAGIMESNSGFSMSLGGYEHYVLVPEISFLNHHCAPNSQFSVDPSLLTISVYTTRAISLDEEVTISYFDPYVHFQPFAKRQQTINDLARFNCVCSQCLAGKSRDTMLEEINALQHFDYRRPGSIANALKLIRLYEQAGFEAFIYIAYGHTAIAYNATGDFNQAQKYARLAADALALGEGFGTGTHRSWQQLINKFE